MAGIEKPSDRSEIAAFLGIEMQRGRVKLSIPECESSSDEWYRRRKKAFGDLRKYGVIPHEIIACVEAFKERTPVELRISKEGDPPGLRFHAKIAKHPTKGNTRADEITAAELLAFFLRLFLRELKQAERSRKAAPVRKSNCVPRSLIAEIAYDLLGSCLTWKYAPGPFLLSLFSELLNLDANRQGLSREGDAKQSAADFLAQDPTISTRELARTLNVNASSVSRWRKSPEFRVMVERAGQFWSKLPRRD